MILHKLILLLYKKSLYFKRNVAGLGTGYKIKDGKLTDKPCILVGVKKKQTLAQLASKDIIPKKLLGVDVDVLEVGDIEHLWRKKHRPVRINGSACWIGGTACSVGLPLYDAEGTQYLLMNKHCSAPFGAKIGDATTNPSPLDGGRAGDAIGKLKLNFPEHYTRKDNIDYALVELDEPMVHKDVAGNTYIPELHSPQALQRITKGSRTTQDIRTSSPIVSVDFEATVRGKDGKIYTYPDCVLTLNVDSKGDPIVLGGCSSSIGFINNKPSVQTFAGSEMVGVYNKIENTLDDIYNRFGLELFLDVPVKQEGWVALGWWTKVSRLNLTIGSPCRFRANPGLDGEFIKMLPIGEKLQMVGNSIIKDNYFWVKCTISK